jgi:Flp pilus assembly pilin Flp
MHRPCLARPWRDERGATSSEYALLASLIAAFIIGSVTLFGLSLGDVYDRSCNDVAGVAGGSGC